MSRKLHRTTRKTHRYLGLFIGIQFLFWTLGGVYFSWNNMNDVHGKTLIDKTEKNIHFKINESLISCLQELEHQNGAKVKSMQGILVNTDSLLRIHSGKQSYLLKKENETYKIAKELTEKEVVDFVKSRLYSEIPIAKIEYLTTELSSHHEYRGKILPVYAVSLQHDSNTVVYVSSELGQITAVRNDNWRRFDFLWMLHVMDFETRDAITNWVLRIFSILGLATIASGFYLYYLSSPTIRNMKRKLKKRA